MIPYGKQEILQSDINAVVEVLKSDFLTQGPVVPEFEASVAQRTGSRYAFAMNSATSALHAAVASMGLGHGDLMWTTPITFVASANCGRFVGADVDFVDIDPDTFNMCPMALEEKLKVAEKIGRMPKVIIPVHMCGQSADMGKIYDLVSPYGIKIIEDASHAIGGSYRGKPIGACRYSDITIFSFHPVKIITSGEGGMALTNDESLANKMALFRSHGITRDASIMTSETHGPWYYQQLSLGWNYRMTELQAALGLSQLSRLSEYVRTRNAIADRYDDLLSDFPISLPGRLHDAYSAFHLYVVRLQAPDNRLKIFNELRANGIGVNLHYIPVHLQPYYQSLGFSKGNFPVAEDYYSRAISIPLFAQMSDGDQDKVVSVIRQALAV